MKTASGMLVNPPTDSIDTNNKRSARKIEKLAETETQCNYAIQWTSTEKTPETEPVFVNVYGA